MSTQFVIHDEGDKEVVIDERSAKFCLDLYDYPYDVECGCTEGPQRMTAKEALDMAAGIIYAVWCSYPDEANQLTSEIRASIPNYWNRVQWARSQ